MKATIIEDFGGTDVFASAELEKPNVKPGHVVVKVAATSVNTIDMMIRQMGTDLPFAPALISSFENAGFLFLSKLPTSIGYPGSNFSTFPPFAKNFFICSSLSA